MNVEILRREGAPVCRLLFVRQESICPESLFVMRTVETVLVLCALSIVKGQEPANDTFEFEKFAASIAHCEVEIEEPCSSGKILFYIHLNQSNTSHGFIAVHPNIPLYFDKSKETKVIIHGFLGHVDSKDSTLIRNAYTQINKFNLITVDWGELVKLPCYPTAVFSTWQAGRCTALFLKNFITDQDYRRVHVIGFSLGAHVAGFSSNLLEKALNKKFGRITGLDPALPFFASLESSMKLDYADGDFVDMVHTNIGIFGKIEPTGHVDFYMNGGLYQPACHAASNIPLCSHRMAILYYAESVTETSKGFWGFPCKSHFHYLIGLCFETIPEERVLMGDKCDRRSRGIYFVRTSGQSPYALG